MRLGFVKACILISGLAALSFGQVPDFIAPAAYPTPGDSAYVASADFNGDGQSDIVTFESAAQSLSILFGTPEGAFRPASSRALGLPVTSLIAADLNGDRAADLVLTANGQVAVLLNDGAGSFAPPRFYVAGVSANYVTAVDLNRDGALELVVAGTSGLAVFRGLGAGTFNAPAVMPTVLSHYWVGAADFNRDGRLDLVTDGSPGAFFAGNGDGTFAAGVSTIVAVSYGAAVGDFNADGKNDIAYLINTYNQERVSGQQIAVLSGMGDGTFMNDVNMFFPGSGSGQVAAGDFNGDGRTDLAIWLATAARLYLKTDSSSLVRGVPVDLSSAYGAGMSAAAVDANGSMDLLLLNKSSVTLLRNTHGDPPLLASVVLDRASVVGGAQAQGTLTLGGPAPAGGASVALTSSDPAEAYFAGPTVTIPAGSSTARFTVSTVGVPGSSPVTISAAWNGVAQTATLTVVPPYALSGLTVSPASQFGGSVAQGTVTLTGPADSNATVSLTSSNPAAASVPATVQVPAGATSASFSITTQPVTTDTPVVVTAALGGVTFDSTITVLRALDRVQLTRAQYTVKSAELRIEATTTNPQASLSVWNATTGAFIGNLSPGGGGKYTGSFTLSPTVLRATVMSSLGGLATGPVTQK